MPKKYLRNLLTAITFLFPFFLSVQDLAPFKNEAGVYGYKNSSGKVVVAPKYMSALPFSEGLAAVWSGKGGYIDVTGKEVIPLQFATAQSFHNGVAKVYNGTE